MGRQSRAKRDARAARAARSGDRPDGAAQVVDRLRGHEQAIATLLPGAWADLTHLRTRARSDGTWWPQWCWLPMAAAHAVVTSRLGDGLDTGRWMAPLAALDAWRQTRTIYRFTPELYAALADSDPFDTIPTQALQRLPEWCVYVALPQEAGVHGFFAFLEYDLNHERPELRLVVDDPTAGLVSLILYLDRPTIRDALRDMVLTAIANAGGGTHDTRGTTADTDQVPGFADGMRQMRDLFDRLLPALLYLCTREPDITDPDQPTETAQHTPRHTPDPTRPVRLWETGYRIATALHDTTTDTDQTEPAPGPTAPRRRPRPHLRRGHWHHYWVGPRDSADRTLTLHWLPPTLVNARDSTTLPTLIHDDL